MKWLPLMLLCGCATTIDLSRAPPADWPQLYVVVTKVSVADLQKRCHEPGALVVFGCVRIYFGTKTCIIYMANDDPAILEHETLHCKGYDHRGESSLRDAWARWKQ